MEQALDDRRQITSIMAYPCPGRKKAIANNERGGGAQQRRTPALEGAWGSSRRTRAGRGLELVQDLVAGAAALLVDANLFLALGAAPEAVAADPFFPRSKGHDGFLAKTPHRGAAGGGMVDCKMA
jgi:hypothetical protein